MRSYCYSCRKPQVTCYCAELAPMASRPRAVILMHPLEARHPVGTGRMAHRCLSNSRLWVGTHFDHDSELARLIEDPGVLPLLLFPGPGSVDLACVPTLEREPVIIVLDATWHLAQKMLHHSPILKSLPRVSFSPDAPSRFLIRRQPRAECLSSLEAICRVLELSGNPEPVGPMLRVFDRMVAQQLAYAGRPGAPIVAG